MYKATVTTNIGQPKIYIGSTEHSFKTRFNNHKISLKYRKHSHSTCISKYIWELKDKGTDHEIKWSIIKRAKPYSGKPSRNLCTRGNSLAKSGRPKAGKTNVRSEVSKASEGPNASSLCWRTPMVSLCLIQILYLITDWLFKNVFLSATAVGQKRSREMNRFFQ